MAGKSKKAEQQLEIGGRQVRVSNLDKVLYEETGFSKAQVIDYYIHASEYLLPHFRDRPVTLKRYPSGVGGQFFYDKDEPSFAPDWIETFPVPRHAGGPDICYILINDLATLVWCANAASLELHPFLHRVPEIDRPTSLVFDLDPGEGVGLVSCAETAFLLRDLLARLNLKCFPKVSGSKGVQVYVPLNTAVSYSNTRPFARAVADFLAKEHPENIVAEMAKAKRTQKVFIDWSQNSDFKTTVGVYSLRAKRPRPFVSLPVTWDELEALRRDATADMLCFEPEAALKRLERSGDLFAPVLTLQQQLPEFAALPATAPSKPQVRRVGNKTALTASAQGSRKRFVVQQHAASQLHYDFRLEMHGVLKSWAIPKGVPYEPGERRLAMATEDHPLDYLEFEGIIPEGQYGGGTVMVWDIGTYELVEGSYYKGEVQLFLQGKKLKGEWRLVKDRRTQNRNWFLEKVGDAMKPPAATKEKLSALTARSLEDIAAQKTAIWHSNRTSVSGVDLDKLPRSDMKFVEPMMAKAVVELPEGLDWQYEVKWDGYRALGIKDGDAVRLLSRRNNDLSDKFPDIVAALRQLETGVIVDGEVVALEAGGRPSFNLLQHHKENARAIVFYLFDVVVYRGRDVRGLALRQRRELLQEVLSKAGEPIRISSILDARPDELIQVVKGEGLEGIVAKRADSFYESGERSGNWVKYRVNHGQELVIGGYRPGKNGFDNLAVGYYNNAGKLIFIAKIRNGFTPDVKEQIFQRFAGQEITKCPFDNLPEPKNARRGEAMTADAMKNYRWLKPELVAQIDFTDWTAADHLRHATFAGLRDDKAASEVVKEF